MRQNSEAPSADTTLLSITRLRAISTPSIFGDKRRQSSPVAQSHVVNRSRALRPLALQLGRIRSSPSLLGPESFAQRHARRYVVYLALSFIEILCRSAERRAFTRLAEGVREMLRMPPNSIEAALISQHGQDLPQSLG